VRIPRGFFDRSEVIIEICQKNSKIEICPKKISKMTSYFKKNFQEITETKTDKIKNRDKPRLFLIQKQI
jgi:hypothetical protein